MRHERTSVTNSLRRLLRNAYGFEGVCIVLIVLALIIWIAWSEATSPRRAASFCHSRYAQARTAKDTAQVDEEAAGSRPAFTCRDFRQPRVRRIPAG